MVAMTFRGKMRFEQKETEGTKNKEKQKQKKKEETKGNEEHTTREKEEECYIIEVLPNCCRLFDKEWL